MVKKLFKHELLAYLRIIPFVWLAVVGVAALSRIVQMFEVEAIPYQILFGSTIFVYALAILGALAFPLVFGIIRFYKNLFTGEGYLSFTLPVTPFQHVMVKVLAAVLMSLSCLCTVLISVMVITAGDVFTELLLAAKYLLQHWIPGELSVHIGLYAAELFLTMIVATFSEFLLFYTCIAIGHTFKKNRILGAVIAYIVYYVICQVLSTILMVVLSVVMAENGEEIGKFFLENTIGCIHGGFAVLVAISAVLSVVYFLITHGIIRKKLNLE